MALSLQRLGAVGRGSALAVAAALAGCAPGASFDSPDSTARLKAIRNAGASNDRASIPNLIEMLDSDDPAVRVMAIGVLEDMTGETHGYDPYGESMDRREAVERWEAWYQAGSNESRTSGGVGDGGQSGAPASRSKVDQPVGGGGGAA